MKHFLMFLSFTAVMTALADSNSDLLEGYRDFLDSPELVKSRAAVTQYLADYGAASEKFAKARFEVEAIQKSIPLIEAKVKPLVEKRKQYLEGKIKEGDFKPTKEALDAIEKELSGTLAKWILKEAALKPLEAEVAKAQEALATARKPVKDVQDKMLGAMAQSLTEMTLQQKIDQVKLAGLTGAQKLDVVEGTLASTVLENYVRAKMGKLLGSDDFCKAVQHCSNSAYPGASKELKGVFPEAAKNAPSSGASPYLGNYPGVYQGTQEGGGQQPYPRPSSSNPFQMMRQSPYEPLYEPHP